MNALARNILLAPGIATRDLELALAAAEVAHTASKGEDAIVLDTFALALFENGRKAEAVTYQKKALELAEKEGAPAQALAEIRGRLERFEKAGE